MAWIRSRNLIAISPLGLQTELHKPADGFGSRRLIVLLGRPHGEVPRFGGHFGASGLLGQYFDLVKIQFLASASVSKSPI
jgi:hypothetical protein